MNRSLKKRNNVSYSRFGYLFVMPFCIGWLVFSFYPLMNTLFISFSDMSGFGRNTMNYVGLKNYQWVLNNSLFHKSFQNTLIMWGISYLIQFPLGCIVAAWLHSSYLRIRAQGFFKFMIYMPSIITITAAGLLFSSLFSYPGGHINKLLISLGWLETDYNFMAKTVFARGLISYIEFWRNWGYGMLVTLAAMMAINKSLFDAAEVDGANRFQIFFRITIPSIRNVLLFLIITGISSGLQMYDTPKLVSSLTGARTLSMYIFNQAFSGDYKYNTAAAASFIVSIVGIAFNFIVIKMLSERKVIRL